MSANSSYPIINNMAIRLLLTTNYYNTTKTLDTAGWVSFKE